MRKASKGLLLLSGILLALVTSEFLARLFLPIPASFWKGYNPFFGLEVIREYNSLMFRDGYHAVKKPAGVKRVIILGDSIAEGWGVRLNQTFWKLLARDLGPEYEVINLSRHGLNTTAEVAIFEKYGLSYKPDIIILQYCLNDTWEFVRGPGFMWYINRVKYREPTGLAKFLNRHFYLFRLVFKFLEDRDVRERFIRFTHRTYSDKWPGYRMVIRSFARLRKLTKGKIPVIVVIFPYLQFSLKHYPFISEHKKIEELCRSYGFYWIDLLPFLAKYSPSSLMADRWRDPHPNREVHRIAEKILLSFMKEEHLINR